jgi:hypothetical protein
MKEPKAYVGEKTVFLTNGVEVWVLLAHACNRSYSGSRDQEDCGLNPVQSQPKAECSGVVLSSQLHKWLRSGASWFKPSPSKKFLRPCLNRKSWV